MFLSHHLSVTLKHSISFTVYSQHLYPSQYLVLSVSLTISHPLSHLPPNLHVVLSSPFLPFSLTSTNLPTSLSFTHTHTAVDPALKSLQPQRHICVCTSWDTHLMCSMYSICGNLFLCFYPTCDSFIWQLRFYLVQINEGKVLN